MSGAEPLSADRLHRLALEAFRIGNRGRLSLCEVFRVLAETRLYLELGYPSLAAYADAFFHLRRSEAFESVRVANALVELTELRDAFAQGRIGWSALKAITRVATVDSQARWIDFVREYGVEHTLAETRDALRRGRDAPRESGYGLPNLDQKLVLRYSRSDMEKVRTWIEQTCVEVAEMTGADEVSVEQAMLFLCEKAMASDTMPNRACDEGSGPKRTSYRAQIVYQSCPGCRRSRVGTRDGFVEVEAEEVDRYVGSAEPVVIDSPTPRKLRRQILAREAGRCGNPRCRNRASHCHHLEFRSRGGKTVLENEVAVCSRCHALVHAGLLRVNGNANGQLHWSPVAGPPSLGRGVAADRAVADRLPVLQLEAGHTGGGGACDGVQASAFADSSVPPALDPEELAGGLMRLGVPAARSRKIIGTVLATLPPGQWTEASVLRKAIASI